MSHDWKILNVLQTSASQVAALDLGYTPGPEMIKKLKPELLYMVGADEKTITKKDLAKDAFVIYQGCVAD